MVMTDAQRVGHALRVKAPALAEAVVDEQYRMQPDLTSRYGPDGRRHCVRDVAHHLTFLAASVEWDDPRRFADYVAWARGVMAAHGVPPADFLATLQAARRVLPALLPRVEATGLVTRHLDAGLGVFVQGGTGADVT
jgi:hypothetical protein